MVGMKIERLKLAVGTENINTQSFYLLKKKTYYVLDLTGTNQAGKKK